MATRQPILGYIERDSLIHSLTGTTKLVMMLVASLATMIGFDTRLLIAMLIISIAVWIISKISLKDLAVIMWIIVIFMILNNVLIFLFAPTYGVEIYQSRHDLIHLIGPYTVTAEQLFYQLNVTLKYFAVLPIALLFIVTTSPSEFASSLNRIGVPYRISYAVSLALRYIPDVQREFRDISCAQQARGADISRRVPLWTRIRNVTQVLIPLLLSSMQRIETISTAMELRGFGRGSKRSWYRARPLRSADWIAISLSLVLLGVAIALLVVNGGRFYNPFI